MATFGFVFGYIALLLAGLWAVAATTHKLRFLPLAGVALQLLALAVGLASTLIKDWHWQLGVAALVALIWVRSSSMGGWLVLAGLGLLLEAARSALLPGLPLEDLMLLLASLLILPVLAWSIYQWRTSGPWTTRGMPPIAVGPAANDDPEQQGDAANSTDPLDSRDAQDGADKYMRE